MPKPITTFTAAAFTEVEQHVIYGCLLALIDDIHSIAFNFNADQSAAADALVVSAEERGQAVLELVVRAQTDGIEDLVDFTEQQWAELDRFKDELQEIIDAR